MAVKRLLLLLLFLLLSKTKDFSRSQAQSRLCTLQKWYCLGNSAR